MIKFDIQMFGGRGASSSSGGRKYDGSVSLSSYGKADAYKASKIRKGDILLWNYGFEPIGMYSNEYLDKRRTYFVYRYELGTRKKSTSSYYD